MNMGIIKCITNGWLIRTMIIKGRNSGHNKITHNKGKFRDGVCIKSPNRFEWKSFWVIIWTYRILMKVILSDILQGEPLWPSYSTRQFTGSVLNTDKKGSKQLFETVLLDSALLDINHTVPDFLTPQRFQWFSIPMQKMQKVKIFGLAV